MTGSFHVGAQLPPCRTHHVRITLIDSSGEGLHTFPREGWRKGFLRNIFKVHHIPRRLHISAAIAGKGRRIYDAFHPFTWFTTGPTPAAEICMDIGTLG